MCKYEKRALAAQLFSILYTKFIGGKDMLQTYKPHKRKRKKVHGFRKRMRSYTGVNVITRRRRKGRKRLSA